MATHSLKAWVQLGRDTLLRDACVRSLEKEPSMITPVRAGALAGLLLMAVSAAPALAETPERAFDATTLDLAADGEVEAAPDQATITLGVQTSAPTAARAMSDNAQAMNAVMAALAKAGIAPREVRTTGLNLAPQYDYPQGKPPALTGYQAIDQVTITVNDLARLGSVVDAVTAAGANQVSGISFGLKDSTTAADAARQAAVKALTAKAELYAQATGYHIVRLVNLTESGGEPTGPVRPLPMMRMAAAAMPTPVSPGELTVRADITGVFELAK